MSEVYYPTIHFSRLSYALPAVVFSLRHCIMILFQLRTCEVLVAMHAMVSKSVSSPWRWMYPIYRLAYECRVSLHTPGAPHAEQMHPEQLMTVVL